MKRKIAMWIFGATIIGITLLSGCCGSCDENYLGIFPLKQNSLDGLDFTDEKTRVFATSNINNRKVFTYELPEYTYEMLQANCETNDNCGDCCDEYESQVAFIKFAANDASVTFSMNLRKDFLNYIPEDKAENIGDFFSMTMNNKLTGELFLDNPELINRVTLNNVDYDRVFGVFANVGLLDTTSTDPAAFYFTEKEGIVGYKLANGEVWNLQ